MNDDPELLRRYATQRDEEAFAELVRRHLDLVHSAALRQVNGDAHLAQDVAQRVFADLARKAGSLADGRVLAGWLFVSTRYAAAKLVRGEQRRRMREMEAHMNEEFSKDDGAPGQWERVRPVLDEAMGELSEADREAILLRFFEGRGFAEVGERLRLSENTARMRVERALDKLHALLARRGVTSTTGALAVALANQAVVAAPAGLAVAVTGAVLAGAGTGAAASGAAATFMGMTKLQLGLTGMIAAAGASGFVIQQEAAADREREIATRQVPAGEIARLREENLRLAKLARVAQDAPADHAELAQLRSEAAGLREQIDAVTQARREAEVAAQRAKELAEAAAAAKAAATADSSDRLPRPSFRVPPAYPAEMMKAGLTGEVLVGFVVNAKGDVKDAFAVRSTRPEFEAAAVAAVAQWKFEPGLKSNRAVNTRMQQVISFSLAGATPTAKLPEPVNNSSWF